MSQQLRPSSRSRSPGSATHTDRGSVTVEAAVTLFSVVVVLTLCLAGIGCAIAQVQCVDAAREAARLVSRGDDAGATRAASDIGPSGGAVSIERSGSGDDARVSVTVRGSPLGGLLPVSLSATAVAAMEPSDDDALAGRALDGTAAGSGDGVP